MGWRQLATPALALLVAVAGRAPGAAAAIPREAGPTPPRLSFTDGEVSFWRPGAEDWAPAKVNTPLAAGDSLYTGDGANLELQVGASAFVRAGAGTELASSRPNPTASRSSLPPATPRPTRPASPKAKRPRSTPRTAPSPSKPPATT